MTVTADTPPSSPSAGPLTFDRSSPEDELEREHDIAELTAKLTVFEARHPRFATHWLTA